jgi:signal transduction histidine kinase
MCARQRRRSRGGAAFWVLLTLLIGVGASAQEEHKRVLLLYDEDTRLPGLAILDQSLRSTLNEGLGNGVEFFTESMNVSQFTDVHDEEVLREYYAKKYRDRKLDLIVGMMGPAFDFLLRHGDGTFPGVPIVFCGADAADIQGTALPGHVTGILVKRVFAPTIDVLLRLQPETRRIVVVAGTSPFDRHLLMQARSQFQAFEPRASFEYLTDLPMDDLLAAVSRLPARSVIVFVTLFRDGAGRAYVPHDVVSRISTAANVPVYAFVDQYLGGGAVGGHLYSLEQHGKSAAEVGLRVLRGELPATIPVRELASTADMFDARQLARWRLDERRLPAGSIVRFREPGLWDRYRRYIISGVALLFAQTALIAGLLFHRARRRRTEADLRDSYERIRNLGGRLLSAQDAERAHLARELHDDIAQQMSILRIDLETLRHRGGESIQDNELLAETSARAAAAAESLRELSHRLHPANLRLVGLTTALRNLQRELSMSGVSIIFSSESVPASLSQDVMMCVYRVAQESLNNAIKHGHAKEVSVRLRGAPDGLTMTVDDNGMGFDVRTVPRGLGLISMSERVEQLGGTLQIRSEPGGGTRLEVRIPCATEGAVAVGAP